ncbi:MAG: hypothetical protein K9I99_15100 [Melioribacteraceae bacterium]|nr:hypothetical protein [Melioribacteraceae bacterium]MCF8414552.1 hypothetical protein [Melioribacteraceae bacterium]
MNSDSERINALGRYEVLKRELSELGIRAGSHLESLRKETDTLLTDKDFLSIDFSRVKVLTGHLVEIQTEAKEKLDKIKLLSSTYKFD